MKKKFSICSIFGVVLLISFSVPFISCKNRTSKERPVFKSENLVAHFDDFNYKGNDDFYNLNPLPDKDYFYNPILPGWYSDPSLCSNGKDFFLVTSTFSFFPGVPIFHSTDLVNWKQIGHVLNKPNQLPLDGQKVSEGIFAPAISYNPNNQTYYMVTTNIKKGNFFVKTKDPFGDWSDPIWLPDVHGIDPSFFFDDDGKAYIVNNDVPDGGSQYQGHRSIRVLQFDVENDKTFGPSIMLVNGGVNLNEKPIWIEGPHMYKINGSYFLMCAEGGTSVNHREVIFKGNRPLGNFKPWKGNPILTQRHLESQRDLPITCAGHADLIKKEKGEWWSVFLACRPIDNKFENLGRETYLMPVQWSNDGYPYMTKNEEVVPRIVQMKGLERDSVATFGNFEKYDDFESSSLGMEWMTLRGDASKLYSLTDNKGYLTLHCAKITSSELKSPAFVSRRLQHHKFECSTTMYFTPQLKTESAGMLLFKDESHQYLFSVNKGDINNTISITKVKTGGAEVLEANEIKSNGDPIKMKVISDGKKFSFYYAVGDGKWNLLSNNIDAYYLSTAQSYGFTGTNIGLYATSKPY